MYVCIYLQLSEGKQNSNNVKDGLADELVDRSLDEDALLRVVSGEEDVDADMQKDTRASYEVLKKLMDKEQVGRLKNARDGDDYIDVRDKMKRVPDGRGGHGVGSK
ncbi:unnamed protein product [Ectocarpus sp. CCAP 1310/34]|nr:unnamed protein product [Ectocarpus sp. CCAP 1310/34]